MMPTAAGDADAAHRRRRIVGSVWRRWSIRIASGLVIVSLAAVAAFHAVRPHIEALVVRRAQAAASQRGWAVTFGLVHLTAWLSLDLGDVVLRHVSGARVEARRASVEPLASWRGVTGHAARVRLWSTASVFLPAGLQVDLRPSTWEIDSSNDRLHAALAGRTPAIALNVSQRGDQLHVDARAVAAPMSALVAVSKDGCPSVKLGTIDGDAQLIRGPSGVVEVRLKGRTRGLAVSSLSADAPGCPADAFGAPADLEAELRGLVDVAAGRVNIRELKVRTRGIEASAQLAAAGGTADPEIALSLDIPRMNLAEVLSTAGLDLPARDLGTASLAWHVDGRLLDPDSLVVSQRLDFSPPAQPVPAILRLKGEFVHSVGTSSGQAKDILVSPRSPDFVPLADVPPLLLKALLLAEDTDFYGHRGVDLRELPIALATNFARGESARGASTIPQQLAKNLFLTRRKTVSRKVEEAALALLLDSTLGKQRMLEIYLNIIEWGPGIYGLGPAARHYFGREPSQLSPRQMAFLVVLIPGPVKYQRSFAAGTPTPFFEAMMATLLGKLQAVGALSDQEYHAALEAPLDLRLESAQ
jgi:hypothetical protein